MSINPRWALGGLVFLALGAGLGLFQFRMSTRRSRHVWALCESSEAREACRRLMAIRDAHFGTNAEGIAIENIGKFAPAELDILAAWYPQMLVVAKDHVALAFGSLSPTVVRVFKEGQEGFGYKEITNGVWIQYGR